MEIFSSVERVLSAIRAILSLLTGSLPHLNVGMQQRLLREANRLREIDAAVHSFRSVSDSNQEDAVDNVAILLGEMAYSVVRNQVSEKICLLLFVSETNELRGQSKNWRLRVAPPHVAMPAALLALIPVSFSAEVIKKPNDSGLMLVALICWIVWIVLLKCACASWRRALRQDIFSRKLHPLFTGADILTGGEIKKALASTVDAFHRTIGGAGIATSGLVAWGSAILSGFLWLALSFDAEWGVTVIWFNVSAHSLNLALFIIMAVCAIAYFYNLLHSELLQVRSV